MARYIYQFGCRWGRCKKRQAHQYFYLAVIFPGLRPGNTVKEQKNTKITQMGGPVSNVWLVRSKGYGPILIDTGFSLMWPLVMLGLRKEGLVPGDLAAIILTHRHTDHAGNAVHFQKAGVPVYAHKNDADILTGIRKPPVLHGRPGPVAWMNRLEHQRPVRLEKVETLQDHDKIVGFDVFHCPGHTMGSIFLFHQASLSLFTGDGLLNAVPPYVQKTALSLPYPDFCDDYRQSLESLRCFLGMGLEVNLLYPGHGPARKGPINKDLKALLDRAGIVNLS